jgi:hypothetical protein
LLLWPQDKIEHKIAVAQLFMDPVAAYRSALTPYHAVNSPACIPFVDMSEQLQVGGDWCVPAD